MNRSRHLLKRLWNPSITAVRHHPYPAPFIHFLQNHPGTQYTQLRNGLTIATEEREGAPNACIGLYIDAGCRYENEFERGVAHFFEHIAFKSTRNRNKAKLSSLMTCLGANFKCFTTREMAAYYVQCLCPDVPLVVDLLADCVFNNEISCPEIEYQKKVVYEEMLKHDSDPNAVLYDYLHSSAYQGTVMARSIMGPSANLYNYDPIIISGYLNRCFDPARTVLAAVGSIKHDQIVSLATCYLNNLEPLKCMDVEYCRFTGSEIRYRDDSMPVANIIIAVEGPGFCEDDNIVMEVARHAVGSWDRSQLHGNLLPWRLARLASIKPVCDMYKSININYKDTGLWGMQFISGSIDSDDMAILIQDEWMYLCNCITEPEVQRAKRFYRAKLLSEMESSEATCHDVGRWTLYHGSRPSILDRINAIDHVTVKDVREVATKFIYDKCPVVVAIGQVEGLSEYNRLRASMYWLRI